MAITLPHGVLFRGAAKGRIPKALIDKHQIESVIGFPDKLFLNTGIPVCVLILKKNRANSDIAKANQTLANHFKELGVLK